MIRSLVVLAAVCIVLLSLPSPAQAHATLLFTTPTANGAVPTSPRQIQLVFDQAVAPAGSALTITGPDGAAPVGAVRLSRGDRVLSVPLLSRLEPGEYEVAWAVTARDGDSMAAEFRFAVGSSAGLTLGPQTPQTPGATPTGVLRWLLFAGLALLLGGLVGEHLARRTSEPDDPRPLLRTGGRLALLGAVGLALVQAGGGSLSSGVTRVGVLVDSAPGRLAAGEVALALVVLASRRRTVLIAGTVGIAILEGLRAHPQAELPGWGAVFLSLHLLAAAVWLGALVHTVRVALRRGGPGARDAFVTYARPALWVVVAVLVAGTLAAAPLVPLGDIVPMLTDTSYGRWLAAKLGLVLVAVALALAARWFLRRGARQPSVAAHLEIGALAGVLVASSALTALAPPTPEDAPLPFPPPPSGEVVALGTRAGWIGIGATASQGQLVIRLVTPDTAATSADTGSNRYTLSGNVTPPRQAPVKLRFRECGEGCFVTPIDWSPGSSTVTLYVDDEEFDGGTAALLVPWPARPAPDLLKKAVAATEREPRVVVHEQVTSDTSIGAAGRSAIPLTGREYLGTGPFGSGVAPVVIRLDDNTLALGYPAEATYVQLTLDHHDRIVQEVLAAPNHLVTRTLIYPEHGD